MQVQRDSVVFAYSFDDIFVSGGNRYLRDYGPNGLHLRFPGAPNDPTPTLTGGLTFDSTDYLYWDGTLATFYSKLPTAQYTWLFSGTTTINATLSIFSAYNLTGGNYYGIVSAMDTSTAAGRKKWQSYSATGGAALPYCSSNTPYIEGAPFVYCTTVETTPRALANGQQHTFTWLAGAYGAPVYDATAGIRIGKMAVGALYYTGDMNGLVLLRGAVSSADMAELSAMMMNGLKPFCVR